MTTRLINWVFIFFIAAIVAVGVLAISVEKLADLTSIANRYPAAPPAGYCIVTNGKEFGYRLPYRSAHGNLTYITMDGYASEKEAIHRAWSLLEYRNSKEGKAIWNAPSEDAYRPLNPELCKNDPK